MSNGLVGGNALLMRGGKKMVKLVWAGRKDIITHIMHKTAKQQNITLIGWTPDITVYVKNPRRLAVYWKLYYYAISQLSYVNFYVCYSV